MSYTVGAAGNAQHCSAGVRCRWRADGTGLGGGQAVLSRHLELSHD
jgi:hypothetical protein